MRWFGIFAVLVVLAGLSFPADVSSCAIISAPGTYLLNQSVSGAPNLYGGSYYTCIQITASNVVFDCQGNNIYVGNASSTPTGIEIENASNVAVRNCNIINETSASYPVGVALRGVTNSNFTDNSVEGLYYGFWGYMAAVPNTGNRFEDNDVSDYTYAFYRLSGTAASGNSVLSGNTISDALPYGYGAAVREMSSGNAFSGNSVTSAYEGFDIEGDNNNLTGNDVGSSIGSFNDGYFVSGNYNRLMGNSAHDGAGTGFTIQNSNRTVALNNTALNNSADGFYILDGLILASHGNFTANVANYNGQNGFHLQNTDNNTLTANTAQYNGFDGFFLADTGLIPNSYNNLTGNTAYNNSNDGFHLSATDHNILKNNSAIDNSNNGFEVDGLLIRAPVPVGGDFGHNTLSGNYARENTYGFYIAGSPLNTLTDNTAINNSNGFRIDYGSDNTTMSGNLALNQLGESTPNVCYWLGSDYNVLTKNNATGCFRGFRVYGSENRLTRNTAQDGPSTGAGDAYGFYLSTSGSVLNNNTAFDNYGTGFYLDDYNGPSSDNALGNNTAYGNNGYGFELYDSGYNLLEKNLAYENGYDGFYVEDSVPASYNNLTSNTARDNGENGFHLFNADNEALDRNTAYNNSNDGFLVENGYYYFSYNTLTNNIAHENYNNGFEFSGEDNSLLEGNTAYLNSENGFAFGMGRNEQDSTYNTVNRNTAYQNGWNGFYLYYSSANLFANNTAYNNSFQGFYVDYGSNANEFLSSTSYYNGLEGEGSGFFLTYGSDDNNVTGLVTHHNQYAGIEEQNADSNNIYRDVQAYNNLYGVYLNYDHNETFINMTVHDNSVAGLYERTSQSPAATVVNSSFYRNGREVVQDSYNSVPFNFSNNLLGPIMRMSIQDEIGSGGGGYSLNETSSPGPAPPNLTSFHGLYLDVYFTGDLGVNQTTFYWTPSEASGYSESSIALYTWNSTGWYLTPNQALDTGNHSLTVYNLTTPEQYEDQIYGLFAVSTFTAPGGDNGGGRSSLSVGLDTNCSGNTVTVTSAGSPIEGADVLVSGDSIGSTDQSGQASFQGCGTDVIIRAVQGGYDDGVLSASLVACGACQAPACTQDSDCATDQKCQLNDNPQLNQCVPLSCACGQAAQDHQCTGSVYQCGSGANCAQCPAGQTCSDNHVCVPSGCTSDLQCKDNEVCRTSSGAPGNSNTPGSCQNVTGQCGLIADHAFVPYNYTCGTEPGCPSCPSGQSCVDHQCVQNDITCPSTVVVGDNANCQVTQNDKACGPADNCTTTVTAPDGTQTTVPPDDAGNVLVGAKMAGKYKIDLLKNGQVVKEVFVDVVPQSQPSENQPPTSAGGGVDLSLVWLLLLLLIVVGAVIYWRSRGQKK